MQEEKSLKEIPYGVSDFSDFRRDNFYYVDKTRFIRDIEKKGKFLFFMRPRRFGKSLFLSILEYYYDIEEKEQFDLLFAGTDIHREPTANKNQYLILKFNFSRVDPVPGKVARNFSEHVRGRAIHFITKYQEYLEIDINKVENELKKIDSAAVIIDILLNYCDGKKHKLYVIIDEYDNFTNTILSESGQQEYQGITHGEGFFRSFFNVLKGGATGAGAPVSRMFITGVSPITMDDVTSGFNIGSNISLATNLNEMLGFTAGEVETMIEYYRLNGKIQHTTPELMELMSRWYNHYSFAVSTTSHLFNTVHVLYFLKEYIAESKIPAELVDKNARTDYNKLRQLILVDQQGKTETNGNFSLLKDIIEKGSAHAMINMGFSIHELMNPMNFVSLLYFLGLLTIQGIDERDMPLLVIPNESVKQLYYDYISQTYNETQLFLFNRNKFEELVRDMAYSGAWQGVVTYIAGRMRDSLGVRDLLVGEKAHQVFWNIYLGLSVLYTVHSEKEMNQGFADLVLEPVLASYPGIKFSYIIEIKYIKPADYKKENSQVLINSLREEAETQLKQYGINGKFNKSFGQTTLKRLALIFSGNLLVYHGEI